MANTITLGLVVKALGLENGGRRIREDGLLLDEVLNQTRPTCSDGLTTNADQ